MNFMKKYLSYILLGLIVLIAVVLRLYKLGEAPAGLYVDEAGQGYSAYSILKTGRDEFGKSFPIVFRSLTDFKTPVYIYLIVPLIPLFGLTPFTVRLPSFIFSILTIPVLFFLIKRLFKDKQSLAKSKFGEKLALLSCFLLAISPWHILFGRTNFECNVALFFFLSGVLFFYKGLEKPKTLILSALMFGIAIPAYHSQRIITPLIMTILFIKFRKILLDKIHKKYLIYSIILGFVITLPTLSVISTPGFLARATGLNIFSHLHQMPDGFIASYKGILSPIVNGSWFLTTREFFSLYFSYLSPRYMFLLGDSGPRSSFPELSTFFLWQFPFYIYGIWILLTKKNISDLKFLTIALLIASPIPAAVTRDPYTTIRSLPLVIPQLIVISLGILEIYSKLKIGFVKKTSLLLFYAVVIYSICKLYSSVIVLNEYYRAKAWDYGWQQVTSIIQGLNTDLPIVTDNARSDAYPQIAFYLKYDPLKFQKENFEVPTNEYYTNLYHNSEKHIGKIVTRPINWEKDLLVDQYLIADELGISLQQIKTHKLILISEVKYPDGATAYRIVRTNPEFTKEEQRLFNSRKQVERGFP